MLPSDTSKLSPFTVRIFSLKLTALTAKEWCWGEVSMIRAFYTTGKTQINPYPGKHSHLFFFPQKAANSDGTEMVVLYIS